MRERDIPVDPARAMRQRGDLIVLVGTSTRVLEDCRDANGALVDAPSQLPSYPAGARDGTIVRPGWTFALAILAGDALGRDERPGLLGWLDNVASRDDIGGPLRHGYRPDENVVEADPDWLGSGFLAWAIGRRERLAADPLSRQVVAGLSAGPAGRAGDIVGNDDAGTVVRLLYVIIKNLARRAAVTASGEAPGADFDALTAEVRRLTPMAVAELDHWDGKLNADDGWLPGPAGTGSPRWLRVVSMLGWLDDVPREVRTAAVAAAERWLLTSDSERQVMPVTALFELAIALEQAGRSDRADDVFSATLDLADRDGHFPEWTGSAAPDRLPASPWLPAHLAFVWAAGVLGRLADLPRSGYTSSRRRAATI